MKIEKLESGIKLIPETDFEKECLKHIANKTLKSSSQDTWHQTGPVTLAFDGNSWPKNEHGRDC
ncbi:MAG: hypothetical protein ACYSW3_22470 [Planctomycetota bacterium]|jgi:hypothetical protein